MRFFVLSLFAIGAASASAQLVVDYSTQGDNPNAIPAASRWWHSDVNSTTAGQNRNVTQFANPALATTGSAPNSSRIIDQANLPAGAVAGNLSSGNAYRLQFGFTQAGTLAGTGFTTDANATVLRAFSSPTTNGSIVVDTTKRLLVDVWVSEELRWAFTVGEGNANPTGQYDYTTAGSWRTSSGSIEIVGGVGGNALKPTGSFGGFLLTPGWNTVDLNFAGASMRGLTGNGIFNPTVPDRAAVNGFFLTPTADVSRSYTVVVDNWRQAAVPEPASMAVVAIGLAALRRRRRA